MSKFVPMNIEVVKSKIHRATVSDADLNYIGSITIDEALMDAANLIEGEKVQIVNVNNGERLETYAIKGDKNMGYPKKHRGRRKIGSKKRRARKRNKKK